MSQMTEEERRAALSLEKLLGEKIETRDDLLAAQTQAELMLGPSR